MIRTIAAAAALALAVAAPAHASTVTLAAGETHTFSADFTALIGPGGLERVDRSVAVDLVTTELSPCAPATPCVSLSFSINPDPAGTFTLVESEEAFPPVLRKNTGTGSNLLGLTIEATVLAGSGAEFELTVNILQLAADNSVLSSTPLDDVLADIAAGGGGSVVPVPAGLPLALAGFGVFGLLGRVKHRRNLSST